MNKNSSLVSFGSALLFIAVEAARQAAPELLSRGARPALTTCERTAAAALGWGSREGQAFRQGGLSCYPEAVPAAARRLLRPLNHSLPGRPPAAARLPPAANRPSCCTVPRTRQHAGGGLRHKPACRSAAMRS